MRLLFVLGTSGIEHSITFYRLEKDKNGAAGMVLDKNRITIQSDNLFCLLIIDMGACFTHYIQIK